MLAFVKPASSTFSFEGRNPQLCTAVIHNNIISIFYSFTPNNQIEYIENVEEVSQGSYTLVNEKSTGSVLDTSISCRGSISNCCHSLDICNVLPCVAGDRSLPC